MCVRSCLKTILILINFVFLIVGGALLALGITLKHGNEPAIAQKLFQLLRLNAFVGHDWIVPLLVAVGIVTLFISFLGFLGGCFSSRLLLYVYSAILITLTIFELVVFVMALTSRHRLEDLCRRALKTMLDVLAKEPHGKAEKFFVSIHRGFECCGVNGPQDFANNFEMAKTCQYGARGCVEAITPFVEKNLRGIVVLAASLMIVQVVAIVASVANGCS